MKKKSKASFEAYLKQVEGLINQNAHFIARNSSIDFDDARQEMIISTWRSYHRYDPNQGASFLTYAYLRMHNRRKSLLNSANSPHSRFTKETPIGDETEYLIDERQDAAVTESATLNKMLLDEIERALYRHRKESVASRRAYHIFVCLRKGMSLTEYSKKANVARCWVVRIFNEKVQSLALDFER